MKNGILIPVGNQTELEKALMTVLSDKKLSKTLGDNAENIKVRLSPEEISNEWMQYINMILCRKGGSD